MSIIEIDEWKSEVQITDLKSAVLALESAQRPLSAETIQKIDAVLSDYEALKNAYNNLQLIHNVTTDHGTEMENHLIGELIKSNESLSAIAASTGHELRNIGTLLGPSIDILKGAGEKLGHYRPLLAALSEGVARLLSIGTGMLDFGGGRPLKIEYVSLSEAVQNFHILAEAMTEAESVTLTTDIPDGLPLVRIDRDALFQIWVNIIKNAVQAIRHKMPDGTIHISAQAATLPTGKQGVIVRFSDSGPGIPKPIQSKIFDMFFSTKSVKGNRGIGMALVLSLANQMGGDLKVESDPEVRPGTTVILQLQTVED